MLDWITGELVLVSIIGIPTLVVILFRVSERGGPCASLSEVFGSFIVGMIMGAGGVGLLQLLIFRERLFFMSDLVRPGTDPFFGKWYAIGICCGGAVIVTLVALEWNSP